MRGFLSCSPSRSFCFSKFFILIAGILTLVKYCYKKLKPEKIGFNRCYRKGRYNYGLTALYHYLSTAPPRFTFKIPPSITIREGAKVSLNISASGNPVPKITWSLQSGAHYNQSRFKFTDNTFQIEGVRFEDQGMITCQGENVFGTRVAQVKLIVFGGFVSFSLLSGEINKAAILLYSWRFSLYSAPIHWLANGDMTSNNTMFITKCHTRQHCENYDLKRETVIFQDLLLFCYTTNH